MRRPGRLPPLAFRVALAVVGSIVLLRAQVAPYDLVIKNARVIDGTGSPWFRADIGIRGDAIATIARRIDTPATRTIDAADQVVAPGFIDVHVHAFGGAGQPPAILPIVEVPTADNYVRQGVTTLITGPDGFSPVPLRPALELAAKTGITPNLGAFIGHGSIRDAVFGSVNRAPTASELERMRTLARDGMRDGAFGLSTGLFYVPATFSKTDEVVELAKVAGAMGGIHISHMRDEELGVEASVRRDDCDRGTRRAADAGHSSQGDRKSVVGQNRRYASADRRGAAARRGRDARRVPIPGVIDQHLGSAHARSGRRKAAAMTS